MDIYVELIGAIIKEQQQIVGPAALMQAKRIPGIHIEESGHLTLEGDGKELTQTLVEHYAQLFGQASVQMCKEAIKPLIDKISPDDLPVILKI